MNPVAADKQDQKAKSLAHELERVNIKLKPTREQMDQAAASIERIKRELLQLEAQRRALNEQLATFSDDFTTFLIEMKNEYERQYEEHLSKLGRKSFIHVVPFIYNASPQLRLKDALRLDNQELNTFMDMNKELEKVEEKIFSKRSQLKKQEKILAHDVGKMIKAEMKINAIAQHLNKVIKNI